MNHWRTALEFFGAGTAAGFGYWWQHEYRRARACRREWQRTHPGMSWEAWVAQVKAARQQRK